MQDNRGDYLSRYLPQVLVRAIYGLWKNKTSAYYAWLHAKSCYYMLIMYMTRVWGMTAQLGVLYSDVARSFNQWERALDPNFVIYNHSFRQQIGHLPRPKFIPHNLSWFLLFCYRSSKNRLNYPYRHNISVYSSFLVCHSPSPINCSLSAFLFSLFSVLYFLFPFSFFLFSFSFFLFPFPFSRSLFPAPHSSLPVPSPLFPVLRSLLPVLYSLFPILYFLFSVPCSPLPVPCSLLPFTCSPFSTSLPFLYSIVYSWTLVVLSSSHARNSHALARENGACFIFIRRLLFMNYLFYLFIYDLLFMRVNL